MIADQWEIPRSELDELAVRSHRLAHQATEEGRFERATIPFQVNGDTYVSDQGIRPDTALEKLSALKPAFKPDRKVTAGNASQISDGATALLMSADRAAELGLTPRAPIGRRSAWTRSSCSRREGDPAEDLPRDTTRPAQGSQPAAKCFWKRGCDRVSLSHPE